MVHPSTRLPRMQATGPAGSMGLSQSSQSSFTFPMASTAALRTTCPPPDGRRWRRRRRCSRQLAVPPSTGASRCSMLAERCALRFTVFTSHSSSQVPGTPQRRQWPVFHLAAVACIPPFVFVYSQRWTAKCRQFFEMLRTPGGLR